jgi:hypothetical protein
MKYVIQQTAEIMQIQIWNNREELNMFWKNINLVVIQV